MVASRVVVIIVIILLVINCGLVFWMMKMSAYNRIVGTCSAGRLVEPCLKLVGNPHRAVQNTKAGYDILLWKSGSKLSGGADIVLIVSDGIVIEVLDIDQDSGKARMRSKYEMP